MGIGDVMQKIFGKLLLSVVGLLLFLIGAGANALADTGEVDLQNKDSLSLHNVIVESVTWKGQQGIRMTAAPDAKPPAVRAGEGGPDANRIDRLAIIPTLFNNGTIELDVAGEPAPDANGGARGFVGVAFRVQPNRANYDCVYLRPTNGRADDQERRNHAVQYVYHPEHPWFRLRKDSPSRYESYVDLEPATWTHIRIVVQDEKAWLYVHDKEQPALIVNPILSGANTSGAIALWIEGSTIAHFANLVITPTGSSTGH
jgi:hypothetical protein